MNSRLVFAVVLIGLAPAAPAQDIGEPVTTLTVDGLVTQDLFGQKVVLSGNAIAVSSMARRGGAGGAVCFYRRESDGWHLEDVLMPRQCYPEEVANHHCVFGVDVSLLENRAVIGAIGGDFLEGTAGHAYVVEYEAGRWEIRQVIRSPQIPGEHGFGFGTTVAQNSDTLAIGAGKYPVSKYVEGAVFLYRQAPGGGPWTPVQTLLAPQEGAFGPGNFGWSLTMTEDLLIVGEPRPFGRVNIFERRGAMWELKTSLYKPGSIGEEDYFGGAVAIDPETRTIVIGDPQVFHPFGAPRPGRAHVFEYDELSDNWTWTALLKPAGPFTSEYNNDRFGAAVSAHDGKILVGGSNEEYKGLTPGSAELFAKLGGTWQQVRRFVLEPGDSQTGGFGSDVAMQQGTLVTGAWWWTLGRVPFTGAAFVYEENLGRESCAAVANSTGRAAELGVLGNPSHQEILLAIHHAPVGGYGVLAMSQGSAGVRFGGGVLCLQEPYTLASDVSRIGPSGSLYIPLDYRDETLASLLMPGSTWTFQFLFRDPAAKAAGAMNTTSASKLTLVR